MKNKIINEIVYIIVALILYLASVYMDMYKCVVIYILTRLLLKEILERNDNNGNR